MLAARVPGGAGLLLGDGLRQSGALWEMPRFEELIFPQVLLDSSVNGSPFNYLSMMMLILLLPLYTILSSIFALKLVLHGAIGPACALISVSGLGFWAGSGTKGMLYGSLAQKFVGIVFGAALLLFGFWLSRDADYFWEVFGMRLSFAEWMAVGGAVGLLITNRRDAGLEGTEEAIVTPSKEPLHSQKIGPVTTPEDERLVAAYEAAMREKRSRGK